MIFDWVVHRCHWLAHVPLAPQLFDALLLTWTALFHRRRLAALEALETCAQRIPNIQMCVHRFGGTGFARAGSEFGHVHGNGLLDVRLGREAAQATVSAGKARPHHVFGPSAWVSFQLQTAEDVPAAVCLLIRGANEADRRPPRIRFPLRDSESN